MTATLPTSGRYFVDTVDDLYDVDVDARIAVWHNLAREAAGEHVTAVVFLFDTVECEVGKALLFDADTTPRAAAAVLGITPAEVTA